MKPIRKTCFAQAVLLAGIGVSTLAHAQTASPPGPDSRMKITEGYARLVARDAFFWAWPMVNVYNRRLTFKDLPQAGLMGGIVPVSPPNRLSMLTDYIEPQERLVACPNQDVVYGFGLLALDQSPIVVQVPDFGDRFWVYQVVDLRTDSFADFGKMYGTKPGFYLLVGRLERHGAQGHHEGVPLKGQYGRVDSACLPGRQRGGQEDGAERSRRHRFLSAGGVRWKDEAARLGGASKIPVAGAGRRGNQVGGA